MDRVVVLRAERGELVVVMLPSHGLGAEMMHVDEAEVPTAGDTAAVVIAERDAPPGGLGQRAELEATVGRDRAHEPAGAIAVEVEVRDPALRTGAEARAVIAPPTDQ